MLEIPSNSSVYSNENFVDGNVTATYNGSMLLSVTTKLYSDTGVLLKTVNDSNTLTVPNNTLTASADPYRLDYSVTNEYDYTTSKSRYLMVIDPPASDGLSTLEIAGIAAGGVAAATGLVFLLRGLVPIQVPSAGFSVL
jgi:hypothetical protein